MKQFLLLFLVLSALQTAAQEAIAVSKEPLHKMVLENQYVRVLDLHIAPGDTTMFHKHETPCVSITLHPARTGSQTIVDDKSPRVPSLDRRINFDGFYQSPRIHRVWNRDTSTYHGLDVEVLTNGERNIEEPIAIAGFTQLFNAPPVRTYRLTLKGNQQLELKRNSAILIVGLNDVGKVVVNKKSFTKQGDFLFVHPATKIELANKEEQEYSLVVMELK